MQLAKKEPYKPQYKEKPKIKEPMSQVQKALFMYVWDREFPCGRFSGRTARDIATTEHWYWQWAEREGLLVTWNIQVLRSDMIKTDTKKQSWVGTRMPSGEVWVMLRECEGNGVSYVDADGELTK